MDTLVFFNKINYELMTFIDSYFWWAVAIYFFIGCLISMSPLITHKDQHFIQIIFVYVRRLILWTGLILCFFPFITLYLYDVTTMNQLGDSYKIWFDWFVSLAKLNWYKIPIAMISGFSLRFVYRRYFETFMSAILKKLRKNQTDELPSDIREEAKKFKEKEFKPQKYYKKNQLFVGLDKGNSPLYISMETWREINMQIIGPTRYGKGVIIGCLMDQLIKMDQGIFYIDPKEDRFAPHIMYAAAKSAGRKFYYVCLHDEGIGQYAPFVGGTHQAGISRLEQAFGLQFTNSNADYYKSQELKLITKAFSKSRTLTGLMEFFKNGYDDTRVHSELSRWLNNKSISVKKGFSIEKALLENAVVYVQGSLDDSVVKTVTKCFISEVIQETKRLRKERKHDCTLLVDEVSFLVSKVLVDGLATSVGFGLNFVLAYQSQNDLLKIDDQTLSGEAVYQSINVNSQVKAIYGGADVDTAKYVSETAGTTVESMAKFERTDIGLAGGEKWQNQRMIATEERDLIPENVMKILPPKVFALFRPKELAKIGFSYFVPIQDESLLASFIESKEKVYKHTPDNKAEKPTPPSSTKNKKKAVSKKPNNQNQNNSQPKDNKAEDNSSVSLAKRDDSNSVSPSTLGQSVPQILVTDFKETITSISDKKEDRKPDNDDKEIAKKARNKKRREAQRAKRKAAKQAEISEKINIKKSVNDEDLIDDLDLDDE